MPRRAHRRVRRAWPLIGVSLCLAAGTATAFLVTSGGPATPSCQVAVGSVKYPLDVQQAENATTIAAVGKRLGMPDHAVTVALAAALQESKLHNLPHGDLDSLGLFQQRPSEGWGTPQTIMIPRDAAEAFYKRLASVSGWESLPVTDAAQAVQHSAAPNGYAQWEPEARTLATAMTGESPAGLTCRFAKPSDTRANAALSAAADQELGAPATETPVSQSRGWTVSSWLVGHAWQYQIPSVAFDGMEWRSESGVWSSAATTGSMVTFQTAGST